MSLDGQQPTTSSDRISPLGLRISADLLIALGCIFALCVLLFGIALSIAAIRYWRGSSLALGKGEFFVLLTVFATTTASTYLCVRAAAALRNARRWAAYVAIGFGLLLLFLTADFFYDWFHPDRQIPYEGYAIVLLPFWVATGLWWCTYLNLPRVRACLK